MKTKGYGFIAACLMSSILNCCANNSEQIKDIDTEDSLSAICENGVFIGHVNDGINEWLGVPYAKPPVGELRWKPTQPAEPSDRILVCDKFSPAPIQAQGYPYLTDRMSEDCLYLNIWSSSKSSDKKKPVMVWIHGGAFSIGSISEPCYQGIDFIKAHPDVILVTIEYRLNMYGFINLSSIPGGENFPTSAANGFLDQSMALNWIHKNIISFGGDPSNVTIFGQSAGGGSVSVQAIMPQSKGTFQKAIAESGAVGLISGPESDYKNAHDLISASGAESMDDLMALSEQELMDIFKKGVMMNAWVPQYGNPVLPENPLDCYKRGDAKEIKMITGTTSDENRIWMTEGPHMNSEEICQYATDVLDYCTKNMTSSEKKLLEDYFDVCRIKEPGLAKIEFSGDMTYRGPAVSMISAQSKFNDSYLYYFSYPSSFEGIGSPHSSEHMFVLNLHYNNPEEILTNGTSAAPEVYKAIQDYWVSFARFGKPVSEGNAEWIKFNEEEMPTLVIGGPDAIRVENNLLRKQYNAYLKLYNLRFAPKFIKSYYDPSTPIPEGHASLFNSKWIRAQNQAN